MDKTLACNTCNICSYVLRKLKILLAFAEAKEPLNHRTTNETFTRNYESTFVSEKILYLYFLINYLIC